MDIQPSAVSQPSLIDYAVHLFDGKILTPSECHKPIQEPLFVYPDRQYPGFFTLLTKKSKEDRIKWESHNIRLLPDVIRFCDRRINNYISQHSFFARDRKLTHLQSFNTVWVDLDYYRNADLAYLPPEVIQERILDRCQEADLPLPSLLVYSGRGVHGKWLLERPLPAVALSKWNLVQRTLVERFKDFRSDSNCGPTQPLRIEQTTNTESGEYARVLWEQREDGRNEPRRYDFNYLCDRILPLTEAEYKQAIIEGKQKERKQASNPNLHRLTWETFYWGRFQDVRKLAQLRGYYSGLPDGMRYDFMFVGASSLCWFVKRDRLYGELLALGKEFAPLWTPKKVTEHCSFVFKKFKSVTARGEPIDRLLIKNETIMDRLQVTPSEEREMSVLISKVEKQRRHRERMQAIRRAQGVTERAKYEARATERREKARELRQNGLSFNQIAQALGISRRWAINLISGGSE